ncbi:MAG TPA: hypothetical protein VHL08_07520 [Dongiaceae bacterium]|nr:hypothetical protein [Dongiaceae bacterium]
MNPSTASNASVYLVSELFANLGHLGTFDYQRSSPIGQPGLATRRINHYPIYRNVSNYNVGLFAQQAGLTQDETLSLANYFASRFSNFKADTKFDSTFSSLPAIDLFFMKQGYNDGSKGYFDRGGSE